MHEKLQWKFEYKYPQTLTLQKHAIIKMEQNLDLKLTY
jgi:hypothetical protein